jgi:hypothetical protein
VSVKTVDYDPPGPIAREFLLDEAFVAGIMGPFGSGKSVSACVKGMMISMRQPKDSQGRRRSRAAIIRNTYPELHTTTIKTWHEWFPQSIGHWQAQGPPTHWIRGDDGLEAEIMFVALDRPDDVRKLLSMELTWAWINEAREVPKAILDGLTGRVGRFPRREYDKAGNLVSWCEGPQILLDTNPPDADHWWYILAEQDDSTAIGREFLDSVRDAERMLREANLLRDGQRLFSFHRQPGGNDPKAENKQNLDPAYYIRAMAGKRADWIKVYVDGQYGFVQDGKPIYPEYNDRIHCVGGWELDERFGLHVGLDFGMTPAATIGQRTPSGRWLTRHELVSERMGVKPFGEELAQFLTQHYEGWEITVTGDPAGASADYDERTAFDVLKGAKLDAEPASTNDPTVRIEAVAGPMRRLVDGEPGFIVHPECVTYRKGLSGKYCFKRVQVVGDERYHDKPDKNRWSHVCEAGQYMHLGGGEARVVMGKKQRRTGPSQAETDYSTFG